MANPLLCTLLVACLICVCPFSAPAEIILDDFDDPIEIALPEMENLQIETPNVGVLSALRSIDVSTSQTDPTGLVDVAVTRSSHMTGRIDGQYLDDPQNTPLLSIGAGYAFFDDPADLTEGGINNALLIDMAIFQGSGTPPALSVLILDANDVFAALIPGAILRSDSPYTLALPFSSFGFRGGGGTGLADFSSIEMLEVRVRLLQGSRNLDTSWLVQMDRIRVGQIVPEPSAFALAIISTWFVTSIATRCVRPRVTDSLWRYDDAQVPFHSRCDSEYLRVLAEVASDRRDASGQFWRGVVVS